LKHYSRFIVVWLVNSILIYLANSLYPSPFELGTATVSRAFAPFLAGLLLTIICKLGKFLTIQLKIELKGRYAKFAYYWLVNSAGLWIIARLAPLSGFGVSSYYWAVALGFFVNLAQWCVRQSFKRAGK